MQFWIFFSFWLLFCFLFVFCFLLCFVFFFFLMIQSQAAFVNYLCVARFTIVHSKTQTSFHYFHVTRVQGSFLVISAIKTDDQPWTFKWAFTFSNVIDSKTYSTLLNKIHVSESVTILRRQVFTEMTWHGWIKTCTRYFNLPSLFSKRHSKSPKNQ